MLTILFTPVSHAEIYKWTDEHGQVHYGDSSENPQTEQIEIDASTPEPDVGIAERREKQRRLLEILDEERTEKEQKRAQAEEQIKETRIRCMELRKYQTRIKEANILYNLDEEGNRQILDEDSHKKEIAEVDEAVNKYCK